MFFIDTTSGQLTAIAENYLQLEGGYTERDISLNPSAALIEGKHPYITNKGVMWGTFKQFYEGKDKSFNYFATQLNKSDVMQIVYTGFYKEFGGAPAPFSLILWWAKWGTGNAQNEVKFLQNKLGLQPDGVFGNKTVAALWLTVDKQKLANELIQERWRWMQTLSNATENPGWYNGIKFLQDFSDKFFIKKK